MLVNGRPGGEIAASDRGLLYGDGLFETIRFVGGAAPLWHRHMARLGEGCVRLGLPVPEPATLDAEARQVVGEARDAVVRITLTRGSGRRGYAPPADATATRIVAAHPMPDLPADWYRRGIRVRSCALRLACQPRLAGIKHLNRLEQVLARMEWSDPDVVEGLLFDAGDRLVSATAANVFGVLDGVLMTPALDHCGVAGALRAELLEAFPDIRVGAITMEASMRMDEMFLCSSVRGVLPVREVDARTLHIGEGARVARSHWHQLGFDGARA